MKMEQIECSETSAYKIQTPGNYPEESTQHSEHGKSLKSRSSLLFLRLVLWFYIVHTANCHGLHVVLTRKRSDPVR